MRRLMLPSLLSVLFGCHDLGAIKAARVADGSTETDAGDAGPGEGGIDAGGGTDADGATDTGGDAPASGNVVLTGIIRNYFSLDPQSFRAGAKVLITNTAPPFASAPSAAANGAYRISDIPLASLIDLEIDVDQSAGQPPVPNYIQTRTSTLLTDATAQTLDLPAVTYAWMAQVAYQCGLFPTLDAALQQGGFVNTYFTQRSPIFGTLTDTAGQPLAGVGRAAIKVDLGGYTNPNAGDSDPAKVCFLVRDNTAGQYAGSSNAMSDATGRFVVFRNRNLTETGQGLAVVHATGFAPQSVRLRSSGNIGVVTLAQGVDSSPPAMPLFATDVYPLFAKLGCKGCHVPPSGPGFLQSAVRGGMHLDLSGTPSQVYASLSAGGVAGCDNAATPQRLCPPLPGASLLLKKPLAETSPTPSDHQVDVFDSVNDPDYKTISQWIANGALQ